VVALTFDDGPDAAWTPATLQALRECDVRATFFVVTVQIEEPDGPGLIEAILADGHEVQPHCGAHVSHLELDRDALVRDLARILRALERCGIHAPSLWRPPYGAVNPDTSCPVAAAAGLRLIRWTHDTIDYDGRGAETMLDEAIAAPLRDDSVVLMHDSRRYTRRSDTAANTVALIAPLAAQARERGFDLTPLTEALLTERPRPAGTELLPCTGP
jgi:peptidoglycan/xylan/chitin deacetylase (PgdA/CDA1 family)